MSDPVLDLLAAPPHPSMSVDETAVYAGGRRRLRRRALRRTGIGVVAVVGASAIAFGALGTGVDRATLPGTPPPPASPGDAVSATLLDGRYAVELVRDAGPDQPNVVFYAIENGTRVRLAGSSASPESVSLGSGSGAEGVMLGTAPAAATMLQPVTERGQGGVSMDQQPLPGTDYQAVALTFENPADVDTYLGMVWVNAAGEVRDATGTRLPGTKISATDTYFLMEEVEEVGVFTADGAMTKPLSDGQATTLGYGQRPEGKDWSWHSVTLLPEGSRDVSFEWDGATGASEVTLRQVGGKVVAWADASAPGASTGPQVTSVTWTDEAGTRHTEPVT